MILILLLLIAALSVLLVRFARKRPSAPRPNPPDFARPDEPDADRVLPMRQSPPGPPMPKSATPGATAQGPQKLHGAKRPWLTGQARVDWQNEQWAKAQAKRNEDRRIAKEIADQKAAAKAEADRLAAQKSLDEATRHTAEMFSKDAERAKRPIVDVKADAAWQDYRRTPIPPEVKRSMYAFLAGEFRGAEQSPLTHVGYHVGTTQGLSRWDRQRRIEVCFRVEVPDSLRSAYRDWAEPGTTQRLNAMLAHLRRHADLRRAQPGFERAVAEWDEDRVWMQDHLAPLARRFTRRWSVVQ